MGSYTNKTKAESVLVILNVRFLSGMLCLRSKKVISPASIHRSAIFEVFVDVGSSAG